MLEIIRDNNNDMVAVCELLLIDDDGRIDDKGNIVLIVTVEINHAYRGKDILKRFIKIILEKNPQAQKCYWIRDYKYKGRKPREYSREQFEKLIGE